MKTIFLFILFFSITCFNYVLSQTATTWRGPHQSGVYEDVNLLEKWPDDGPEVLWAFEELGIGYSAPAFANNLIYVSGMVGPLGYIYALTQTGELQWKAQYGKEYTASYPGSRATPVIAGDFLYILSGLGDLACISAQNGKSIWKVNIFDKYGGRNIEWGINETVVIHDNKLICTPGGTTNNIIALDRFTGKLIWTTKGKGEKSAYCTPLLVQIGTRNLLVTHTENNILGINADDGALLWNYPHTNKYSIHPNTPLFYTNMLFCFSGYDQGGVMLQLNADGSRITKKWFSNSFDSRMGGAVFLNGKIYGSGDRNREWQCIDWESGKMEYSSKDIGNGVIISADKKLYLYSQRGELALVNPGKSSFEIISETKVSLGSGQHWAHPVIDKGRLFIRHGNALIAYKVSH